MKSARSIPHLAVASTLVAAATVLAAPPATLAQQDAPDLEMGKRLVEARCVVCHQQSSVPRLADRCEQQHGAGYLDTFLKRHHAPDDDARRDIIAYLTCPPHLLPQ